MLTTEQHVANAVAEQLRVLSDQQKVIDQKKAAISAAWEARDYSSLEAFVGLIAIRKAP